MKTSPDPGSGTPAHPALAESGLFLMVVAVPLVVLPFSFAPYTDPKLLAAGLAAGLLLLSRPVVAPNIRLAVLFWLGAILISALLGVDPWWSLFGSPDGDAAGVLLLVIAGVALAAATGLGDSITDRLPSWILTTGSLVATIAIAERFFDLGLAQWVELGDASLLGSLSTLGQPLIAGGYLSAVLVSAVALRPSMPVVGAVIVVASGLSMTVNRGGWLAALTALALLALTRSVRRRAAYIAVVAIVVGATWTVVDTVADPPNPAGSEAPLSPAGRITEFQPGSSALQRPHYWMGSGRAWLAKPLLGWGPATTSSAFLASAQPQDLRGSIGRELRDSHNLLVESLVGTGVVGTIPMLILLGLVITRSVRAGPSSNWAAGAATALFVVHMLQPRSVALTPLMFLFAGIASRSTQAGRDLSKSRLATYLLAFVILLATTLRMAASVSEQYGRTYASDDALRLATILEPNRASALGALSLHRALDHRMGMPGTGQDARDLTASLVRAHPWHVGVRLTAVDAYRLLDDHQGARRWIDQHLDRFPHDPLALAGAARMAMERGDVSAARRFAQRALDSRPGYPPALDILRRTG